MPYLYLAVAILTEVVGTTALHASDGFTRPGPSLLVAAAYGVSFYFLALALRFFPVGITYAIWSGVGMILITLAGWWLYRQVIDLPGLAGIGLIVAGVAVINLFSRSVPQ